jgi:hypothetical protein
LQPYGTPIEQLDGQHLGLLPEYRVKILDGNWLGASEWRLAILQDTHTATLPAKSLVVLGPVLRLAIDLFPCEAAYTSERALLGAVLETVAANEFWICDRYICTKDFRFGIADKQAGFVIR